MRAVSRVITVNLPPHSLTLRALQGGNTFLLLAIRMGDTSTAQLHLERGVNLDTAYTFNPFTQVLAVRYSSELLSR